MDDITVLMTGCGAPGAPGIIHCLRQNGERNIRLLAVDRNENAGARDMADDFFTVPSADQEEFIPAVLSICQRERVDVVVPIVTRELMKFAQNRAAFEAVGTRINVMDPALLTVVNNKANLLTEIHCLGLPSPEFRTAHSLAELKDAIADLGYPERGVCIKAAVGNGSRGVRLLDAHKSRYELFFNEKPNSMYISYEELVRTLSERETIPEMLAMELLTGTEYSVDLLCDHGRVLYSVCRRGLSVVTSNMMSLMVEDNPAVDGLCARVAEKLRLDGNFGFDLLCGENGRGPFVIECNPRLTAGVVACAAAGVNLPYLGVKQLLGESLPELSVRYGMRMSRRYQESFFDADGRPFQWEKERQ